MADVAFDFVRVIGEADRVETSPISGEIDDFEDADMIEYSGATSQTEFVEDPVKNRYSSLRVEAGQNLVWSDKYSSLPNYPAQGDIFEVWHNFPLGAKPRLAFGVQKNDSSNNLYYVELDDANGTLRLVKRESGVETTLDSTNVTFTNYEWVRTEVAWYTDGTMEVTHEDASTDPNTELGTLSAQDNTWPDGGIAWGEWSSKSGESHDGIAFGDNDEAVFVIDAEFNQADISPLDAGGADSVAEVAANESGTKLAAAHQDGDQVRIYDTDIWSEISASPISTGDKAIDISWADGLSRVAFGIGSTTNQIEIYNISTWTQISESPISLANPPNQIDFNNDESVVAAGTDGSQVEFFNTIDWTSLSSSPVSTNSNPLDIDYNPSGTILAASLAGGEVSLIDTSDYSKLADSPLSHGTNDLVSVSFSRDGSLLAAGATNGEVAIWDTTSWGQIADSPLTVGSGSVLDLGFSMDDRYLGHIDGTDLRVFNVKDWTEDSNSPVSYASNNLQSLFFLNKEP